MVPVFFIFYPLETFKHNFSFFSADFFFSLLAQRYFMCLFSWCVFCRIVWYYGGVAIADAAAAYLARSVLCLDDWLVGWLAGSLLVSLFVSLFCGNVVTVYKSVCEFVLFVLWLTCNVNFFSTSLQFQLFPIVWFYDCSSFATIRIYGNIVVVWQNC